jgi:hypothetical protein
MKITHNCVHTEGHPRLNLGSACDKRVQYLLSSRLLFKHITIKYIKYDFTYFCGCETWSYPKVRTWLVGVQKLILSRLFGPQGKGRYNFLTFQ